MTKKLFLLVPFLLLSGCTSESDTVEVAVGAQGLTAPSDDTAEASIRFVMDAVKEGKPVVVWNAIPAKQQDDINDIVRNFASVMDPAVWNQGADAIKRVQKVLETKAEFFNNHPVIANTPGMKDAIPELAGLLKNIIDGASDLEALQRFDGQDFTATTGASLFGHFTKLSSQSVAGANPFAAITDMKIETVDSTATSATLKLISPDGREELQNFMKIEGKWVPMNLVQNWDENVQSLKEKIKNLPDSMKQAAAMVGGISGMLNDMSSRLNNAQTQDEFNVVFNVVMAQAGMAMGQLMGPGPPQSGSPPADQQGNPGDASSQPQQ